jgi:hypothetical protein
MKYAILYSGHLRTFLDTIDSHIERIGNYNDFDIYLNLWDGWGNGFVLKEYQFEDSDLISDEVKNILIDKVKPKFYEFQNYNTIYDEITEVMKIQENNKSVFNSNKIRNVISMYYKLQRGFEHIKNSGINYDGVLRLRPDTFLNGNIEVFKPDAKTLYTSLEPRWCLNGDGVNDQLGFADMEVMNHYTNVYSNLENIWTENIYLNCAPEVLLKVYLDKFNISVKDVITKGEWNGEQFQKIMRENKIID